MPQGADNILNDPNPTISKLAFSCVTSPLFFLFQVYERMRSEGLSDGVAVVNSVHETSRTLTNLVTEHGMAGVAAMTCALLNSLTQLTGAR